MSLYRGYFVPGGIDPTGQPPMDVKKVKDGKCSRFRHEIRWRPGANEIDGYIVQKGCVSDDTQPCEVGKRLNCKIPRRLQNLLIKEHVITDAISRFGE